MTIVQEYALKIAGAALAPAALLLADFAELVDGQELLVWLACLALVAMIYNQVHEATRRMRGHEKPTVHPEELRRLEKAVEETKGHIREVKLELKSEIETNREERAERDEKVQDQLHEQTDQLGQLKADMRHVLEGIAELRRQPRRS